MPLPVNASVRVVFVAVAIVAVAPSGALIATNGQPRLAPTGGVRQAQSDAGAFDVVSIRPAGSVLDTAVDAGDPCSGGAAARLQLKGSTVSATMTTLYGLIVLAYNPWKASGGGCAIARMSNLVSGPEWIRSERFDVQAQIPAGTTVPSNEQLWAGEAPAVQAMLQAVLRDRFGLVVGRQPKEIPVYLLTADQNVTTVEARMAASLSAAGGIPERLEGIVTFFRSDQNGNRYNSVAFKRQSMAQLAQRLAVSMTVQRPVLDRTALTGIFDFVLEFDDTGVARPTLFGALQEQLGLRLRPSIAPVDTLVVDQVHKPTPN